VLQYMSPISDFNAWVEDGLFTLNELVEEGQEYLESINCSSGLATGPKIGLFEIISEGDTVRVWSNSKQRWCEGRVIEVVKEDGKAQHRHRFPRDTVCVAYEGGKETKWILPAQRQAFLQRDVATAKPSRVAAPLCQQQQPQQPKQRQLPGAVRTEEAGRELEQVQAVERRCKRENHTRYEDPEFKPYVAKNVDRWCRPEEITYHDGHAPVMGSLWSLVGTSSFEWVLFRGPPSSDDVRQGGLGDCWFLSSLAALAEFKDGRFIRALLPQQSVLHPLGVYVVRLCLGGCWRSIVVDDLLPCVGGTTGTHTSLAYCTTRRAQLWASVVEKAYAKACGSYERLVGGESGEALSVLTGWPCTMVIFSRPDFDCNILWATLLSSRDAGFLMTCSTPSKVKSPLVQPSHVYSLLDVHEVASDGVTYRLLKIRNPYAKEKWQGEWSDASIKWTADLRRKLGFPKGGIDGVFFMSLNDFTQNFAHCTICKIREGDWAEARETMQVSDAVGRGEVLQLDLRLQSGDEATTDAGESVECCISVAQLEHRARRHPGNVTPLGFVLFRQVAAQDSMGAHGLAVEGVIRLRGDKNIRSMDCWLQAGFCYLLVPLLAQQCSQLQATCACVSSRPVLLHKRPLEGEVLQMAWAEYKRRGVGGMHAPALPSSAWWWS